uniref:GDT1 family protein n=1 Tax=Bicosoecida sp. CB-2014 TaxID=1486930 RepID=A0A7S1CD49_9STRA
MAASRSVLAVAVLALWAVAATTVAQVPGDVGAAPTGGAAAAAPVGGGADAWANKNAFDAAPAAAGPGAGAFGAPNGAGGSLRSAFPTVDANGDGCVDASEFADFERDHGLLENPVDSTVRELKKPALEFWASFGNSVIMIIVTELGDKTFFIAAILAMQYDRAPVFGGAIGALALMTALSAAIGWALPAILPKTYTHYAAVALFAYFGAKLLKEAREMKDGEPNEELEEAERELGVKDEDVENGKIRSAIKKTAWAVFTQTFTLTFLAEWGDRSQIATIALATAKDPMGVTLGGTIGHSLCTGLAVLGGKMLSSRISERTVLIAGGVLFCLFALHGLWAGSDDG